MEVRFGGGELSTVTRLPDSQKVEAFPWFKYLLKPYQGSAKRSERVDVHKKWGYKLA